MKNYQSNNKIPLYITIAVAAFGLFFLFYSIVSPKVYKNLNPNSSIGYIFVPDYDEHEGNHHLLIASIIPFSNEKIISAKAFYKKKNQASFNSVELQQISKGNNWAGELPPLKKGERFFYFLEITYLKNNQSFATKIPHWAPNKPLLYVTYEGKPSKSLLLIHIVTVVGAALFLLHSLYFALNFLMNKNSDLIIKKVYSSVFWAWLLFSFSTLLLGYFVAKATFGKGWNGIPIGDDITDNKSLFLSIFWAILLFLAGNDKFIPIKKRISEKKFCIWIIIGIIITTLIYLIPHSYFFQ